MTLASAGDHMASAHSDTTQGAGRNGTLLLVTAVRLRNGPRGLQFDDQTCAGVCRWAERFEKVVHAGILIEAEQEESTSINWVDVRDLPVPTGCGSSPCPWPTGSAPSPGATDRLARFSPTKSGRRTISASRSAISPATGRPSQRSKPWPKGVAMVREVAASGRRSDEEKLYRERAELIATHA